MADDEGLHSGHVIFGRRGYQGKAPDHYALHDEVHLAEWGRGCYTRIRVVQSEPYSFPSQLVEVTVEGLGKLGSPLGS